ncbi:polysaccharide deacetylase family protein [Edwardsiella tarda]|uniref:polysaccharide deacetylase family protein n=2 Tax=Edwardsiella tarda TaxID=636 RepID=UPI00083AD798|nr:polysaccharide deacetylase family protein [Edwardsiella tarda]UCQ10762.1 polysaccharide deacetylase family protein [Edwardsiella tarda]UCQ27059.1 polysaccharide deacetylase family protein [Edwardsiella tarda]UCQ53672.1 polysaccharide deacetylase family protein [Edwardsiella tarda]WGE28438.1 polysaccharide deacetylase family protein [Edwardsiella tarda]
MYKSFCWAGLLLLVSFSTLAQPSLPSASTSDPIVARYMVTAHASTVYSPVGDRIIPVARLQAGTLLEVQPDETGYFIFRFANASGFIARDALVPASPPLPAAREVALLHRKSRDYLLTLHPVMIYGRSDLQSPPLATLAANLRYPILAEETDTTGQRWMVINLGGRLAYVRADKVELDNGIPILTYHHILRNQDNHRFRHTSTTTSVEAFDSQMAYLRQAGYLTISLYQLEGYLRGNENLPARAVALTFDDGLKSVYRYAYPILKKNGQRATAFIVSSRIKRHPQPWNPNGLQFMSLSELRAIQSVFDIQSHTHFLHRLSADKRPILLQRSQHNILFDFARSRRALTQFNPHVQYLSYPFGAFNRKAIEAAHQAGYHMAVTTMRGKVRRGDNPYTLKRLYVLRTDSVQTMARLIANRPQDVPPVDTPVPIRLPPLMQSVIPLD